MLTQEQIDNLKLNVQKYENDNSFEFRIDLTEEIENGSFVEEDDTSVIKEQIIEELETDSFNKLWIPGTEFVTFDNYNSALKSMTTIEFNYEAKIYGSCNHCYYDFTIQNTDNYDILIREIANHKFTNLSDKEIKEILEYRHYEASDECKTS